MDHYYLGLLLVGALCGCAQPEREAAARGVKPKPGPGVFFVATNGDDQWSGQLPAPNAQLTDGPLASPALALEAVRRFRAGQGSEAKEPAGIFIRSGTYFLAEPLALKPGDSGLVISAFPGEWPVLSGGRGIGGWREVSLQGKKLWAAEVPEVRDGKWFFRELWVNGRRAVRARYPNRGYLKIKELPDKSSDWTHGHTRFRFAEGDLKAWSSVTNAEVVAMTRWVESRLPIVSVDEKERIVSFSKRSVFELMPGDLYYAEGAFEFLDQPGEWYLDRSAGTLYYLPRPGETLSGIEAIAPRLVQVLRLEGRPEAGEFVAEVALRDLVFANTEWNLPEASGGPGNNPGLWDPKAAIGGFGQAAVGVPGAACAFCKGS